MCGGVQRFTCIFFQLVLKLEEVVWLEAPYIAWLFIIQSFNFPQFFFIREENSQRIMRVYSNPGAKLALTYILNHT
jgi:hypothetical protein